MPGVAWPDGTYRNLVIVTTTRNSVFVFDADGPDRVRGTAALSMISLGPPLAANYMPMAYTRGDPCPWNAPTTAAAPDPITGQLHALSLVPNLIERAGSPVVMNARVSSKQGAGAANGTLVFDPRMHLQRAALLLQQGLSSSGSVLSRTHLPFTVGSLNMTLPPLP